VKHRLNFKPVMSGKCLVKDFRSLNSQNQKNRESEKSIPDSLIWIAWFYGFSHTSCRLMRLSGLGAQFMTLAEQASISSGRKRNTAGASS
jgi:hypothetical protein